MGNLWKRLVAVLLFILEDRVTPMVVTTSQRKHRRLTKLPPHAGYHGAIAAAQCQQQQPFFEGWYLRVVDSATNQSFAFIFHIFDPHTTRSPRRGVGMQVLTPTAKVVVEDSDVTTFQADSHCLDIRNSFDSNSFFELTASRARGRASTTSSTTIEFDFSMVPQIGWGGPEGTRQYSTAGWLAAFPLFEPHYQVLISKGMATGSITTTRVVDSRDGESTIQQKCNFSDAAIYLEKNWGGSFPSQWWWIQANTFQDTDTDLCVTSTGGRRRLPLLQQDEDVALIGIHWNGEFLPFTTVDWKVKWGYWQINGSYGDYTVKLSGTTGDKNDGVRVRCPTVSGMKEIAFETFKGNLQVELYQKGELVLDVTSKEACLEVGGDTPWARTYWTGESVMKEPLKTVVMNKDLEKAGGNLLQVASFFLEIPGL